MTFKLESQAKLRILDFDTEARPLSYWGDRPTAEITAIASCFVDDIGSMEVSLLGQDDPKEMLQRFVERYDAADIVTAHNLRRYDLPQINGALMEYGLPSLKPKTTIDTYLDMKKKGDIPASQEYLLDLFELGTKVHMGQHSWRTANRLLPDGVKKTAKRVTGDVYDHMRLRAYMAQRGLLKNAKVWRP
jgi:hypothetical protein